MVNSILLLQEPQPAPPLKLRCAETQVSVEFAAPPLALAGLSGGVQELGEIDCELRGRACRLIPLLIDTRLGLLPKVKREGSLKAALRIAEQLSQNPRTLDWWLAIRFAIYGWCELSELRRQSRATHENDPGSSLIVTREGLLIWQPSVERAAVQLRQRIEREMRSNPYASEFSAEQVMKWLSLDSRIFAEAVLEEAIKHVAAPAPSDISGSMAEDILALYERGEGLPLNKLKERMPQHRVVIQQLAEAGQLVESSDGFVFTQRQLSQWLEALGVSGKTGIPGVGQIKQTLGLPRTAAEQLRQVLLAKMNTRK
jgi:hypothetical protein